LTRKIKLFSLILFTIVSFCGLTMVNAELGEVINEMPRINIELDDPCLTGMVNQINSAMIAIDNFYDVSDKIVEETGLERLTPSLKVALAHIVPGKANIVEETGLERLTPSLKVALAHVTPGTANIVEETGLERLNPSLKVISKLPDMKIGKPASK